MEIIETNLDFKPLTKRSQTNRIILHHAAIANCSPEDIHRWHLNNGWSGAGYHFLVRKDGKIYRLRPEWAVGSHAQGSNSDSIGICAEGNYEYETMPEAQKNSIIELVNYLKDKYGISKVIGHRDVNNTSCPGKNYPFDEIVNGSVSPTPTPSPQPSGNDKIRQVQEWLNNNYGTGIAVDGIYGSKTKKALTKALQTELNRQFYRKLDVDGIFGKNTKKACEGVKISKGMKGNFTKTIQGMLICRGYNTNGFDGIFGSGTKSAVEQYQRNNGLDVDGIVGYNTLNSLFC